MLIHPAHFACLAAIFLRAAAELSCFYPNGKNDSGLVPCKKDGSVTHCCREPDVCITNGLCFSAGLGAVLRRGCTDKTWASQDCPNYCTSEPFKSSDADLTPCGGYNTFACGQNANAREACNSGNASLTVRIQAGQPMVTETRTVTASGSSSPTNSAAPATSTAALALSQACSKSMETSRNALVGVAAAFGALFLAVAGLAIVWRRGMKKEEMARLTKENENHVLVQETTTLKGDYDWLYQNSPPPIRRDIDAKKKARVTATEATSP